MSQRASQKVHRTLRPSRPRAVGNHYISDSDSDSEDKMKQPPKSSKFDNTKVSYSSNVFNKRRVVVASESIDRVPSNFTTKNRVPLPQKVFSEHEDSGDDCDEKEEDLCVPDIQVCFCVKMLYDQVLVAVTGSDTQYQPATQGGNRDGIYGVLKMQFKHDMSKMKYTLYVYNATQLDNKVVDAGLYTGYAGTGAGLGVVILYPTPNSSQPRNINGIIAKGQVINSNVISYAGAGVPDNQINTLVSLYQAILQGRIYAQLSTQLLPGGAIRGQIFPA